MTVELSFSRILVFAPDLGVARHFYGDVLGLAVDRVSERSLTFRGADFAMSVFTCERAVEFDAYAKQAGSAAAFTVESLERAISELSAQGVRFLHSVPNDGPDGRYVAFVDPFGTVFELIEAHGRSK